MSVLCNLYFVVATPRAAISSHAPRLGKRVFPSTILLQTFRLCLPSDYWIALSITARRVCYRLSAFCNTTLRRVVNQQRQSSSTNNGPGSTLFTQPRSYSVFGAELSNKLTTASNVAILRSDPPLLCSSQLE